MEDVWRVGEEVGCVEFFLSLFFFLLDFVSGTRTNWSLTPFFIGGLIYVNVLGKPMVIINKLEIARELLDKRGVNYSDRPRLVLLCEMYVRFFCYRISI